MPEALQNILNRIRDWWAKFSPRQKAAIISAAAVVVVALIILGVTMNKTQYVTLVTASDSKEANSIKSALDGADTTYDYKTSDDGLTFYIDSKQQGQARITLGGADIQTDGYTIEDALSGSTLSTTEADKEKRYKVYLETKLAEDLESLDQVDAAKVNLNIPKDDGTLISSKMPAYGEAILTLNKELTQAQAATIANFIATNLGNDDTQNIVIMDQNSNTIFSGGEEASSYSIAAANRTVQQQAEAAEAEKVRTILASAGPDGASLFSNAKIGVSLDQNFDSTKILSYDYSVDEGRDEGYIDSEVSESSESVNGVAGTPGTDANDDTTYVMPDGTTSSSSSSKSSIKRLPDETITQTEGEAGKIDKANSSIGIVAYQYVTYRETALEADGTLTKDMTWDQYQAQNSAPVKQDPDPDVIAAVSSATGIPQENITMLVYTVPFFEDEEARFSLQDILELVMALLILLLLFFVVFRTLRQKQEEEEEEEVSVETLLEEQPADELEDIGYTEKSEARKLIEKFVDENPEAVASLLRNWLNEDWGA